MRVLSFVLCALFVASNIYASDKETLLIKAFSLSQDMQMECLVSSPATPDSPYGTSEYEAAVLKAGSLVLFKSTNDQSSYVNKMRYMSPREEVFSEFIYVDILGKNPVDGFTSRCRLVRNIEDGEPSFDLKKDFRSVMIQTKSYRVYGQ